MSTNANLGLRIRSTEIPTNLPHKTRKEEIQELPDYLEVVSEVAEGLALLNIGAEEPSPDRAAYPWLKLDAGGEPIGLFVYVNSIWEPALSKYYIRDRSQDILFQRGSGTLTLQSAREDWKTDPTDIEFDIEFDDPPVVLLSITGGSILDVVSVRNDSANDIEEMAGFVTIAKATDITAKDFNVKCISGCDTESVPQSVEYTWIAFGTKEDI